MKVQVYLLYFWWLHLSNCIQYAISPGMTDKMLASVPPVGSRGKFLPSGSRDALLPSLKIAGEKTQFSVLLLPLSAPSHWIMMSALGEALVLRGHNVTFCSTEREGTDLPRQLAERAGMTFLSAGPDPLETVEDYLENFTAQRDAWSGRSFKDIIKLILMIPECARRMANMLRSDPVYATAFDIIIADQLHSMPFACLSMKWGIPFINLRTALDYVNLPPWAFPIFGTGYSDNLSFMQRSVLTLRNFAMKFPIWVGKTALMQTMDFDCSECYDQAYYTSEGHTPEIVTTAIGFEYSRSILPMIHYVGPLIRKFKEPLSGDLLEWLSRKPNGSVIYISMGSGARLTKEAGKAIINGILRTNYYVLWSLRESNQDILEGFTLSKEIFYISDWLPQQTILKHKAIGMAILHCGIGGLNEALSEAIPLIVIPYVIDQYDNAARLEQAGAGLQLNGDTLTVDDITHAVETVALPQYKRAALRLRRILLEAGGSDEAARLVEFYAEVGYEHLIPGYIKYRWSWLQYHNVDVYIFIIAVCLVCVLVLHWTIAPCVKFTRTLTKKKKML